MDPIGDPPHDFRARLESLYVGDVTVIEMSHGPARSAWTRELDPDPDRLRLVVYARSPRGVGAWHGQQVPLTRGGTALLGATDRSWVTPAGLRGVELDVPLTAVSISAGDLTRVNDPGLMRRDPVLTTLVRPALIGMAGRLRGLAACPDEDFAGTWISMVTMLVRSLTDRDLHSSDLDLARRVQALQYIDRHLDDPTLDPAAVAAALHVSRRTLYLSFPEGVGVARVIRTRRLQRAYALLLEPGRRRPIAQIGELVGLPDPTHFSRAFKATYGISPRSLRNGVPPTVSVSADRTTPRRDRPRRR